MATVGPQHFLNYHTEQNMSTSHFLVLFWIHVPSYVTNPENVTFTTLFSPGTKHSPCNENKMHTKQIISSLCTENLNVNKISIRKYCLLGCDVMWSNCNLLILQWIAGEPKIST